MKPVVFALPGNEHQGAALARELGADAGAMMVNRFPDDETYVRLQTSVADREVVLICTLDRPDEKLLPLLFLAETARELGAARVGLVAPYLPYLRQERRLHDGEALTSASFARLLSRPFDWLVTVDPHLQCPIALSELYPVPSTVVQAAPDVARWIRDSVRQPLLVAPGPGSGRWISTVAELAGAPAVVLRRYHRGNRDLEFSALCLTEWQDRTPVLVDDVISTARAMIDMVAQLRASGLRPPVCIGVHAVFAGESHQELLAAGAGRLVSCDTIAHSSNQIGLGHALAAGVRRCLASPPPETLGQVARGGSPAPERYGSAMSLAERARTCESHPEAFSSPACDAAGAGRPGGWPHRGHRS